MYNLSISTYIFLDNIWLLFRDKRNKDNRNLKNLFLSLSLQLNMFMFFFLLFKSDELDKFRHHMEFKIKKKIN
jgi:hypothetical protein